MSFSLRWIKDYGVRLRCREVERACKEREQEETVKQKRPASFSVRPGGVQGPPLSLSFSLPLFLSLSRCWIKTDRILWLAILDWKPTRATNLK